jgi:hypothetical protein
VFYNGIEQGVIPQVGRIPRISWNTHNARSHPVVLARAASRTASLSQAVTCWRDEESFQAWLGSESFAHGHRSAAEGQGGSALQPVARCSEVWSYILVGGADPR